MNWLTKKETEEETEEDTEEETEEDTEEETEEDTEEKEYSCSECDKGYNEDESDANNKEDFCSLKCENEYKENNSTYTIEISLKKNESSIFIEEVDYKKMLEIKDKFLNAVKNKEELFIIKTLSSEKIITVENIIAIEINED